MDRLRKLFANPEYHSSNRLSPMVGIWLFVAWQVLYLILALLLWPVLAESLGDDAGALSSITAVQIPLFLFSCIFIVAIRIRFRDLMLRNLLPLEWLVILALAIASFFVALAILLLMMSIWAFLLSPGFFNEMMEQAKLMQEAISPTTGAELAIYIVLLAIVPALVEELFFRGLLMDAFMRWGPFWAITISSVAFGLSHQMPLRIPSMIFMGFVFGILKYKTGKLTASILLHMLYNGLLLTMTYFAGGRVESDVILFTSH